MKKLLILICILFIPLSCNAISLNELRNNPNQYTLVYSDQMHEAYVDNLTIVVSRYNPPYYAINATVYSIWYDENSIVEANQTSFFNYDRSLKTLALKFEEVNDLAREFTNDNGVKFKINTLIRYDLNGNKISSIDSFKFGKSPSGKAPAYSPSYEVAMYIFHKSYNMYFNESLSN